MKNGGEGFDVYLYRDGSADAQEHGADRLAEGFPSSREAITYAEASVASGRWERAIVGVGDDVHEVFDTGEGDAVSAAAVAVYRVTLARRYGYGRRHVTVVRQASEAAAVRTVMRTYASAGWVALRVRREQ